MAPVSANSAMSMFFVLMVLLTIKHFVADYPAQTQYMLRKGSPTGWVVPLAAHCAVHMVLTSVAVAIVSGNISLAVGMGILDFVVHFAVDTVKARLWKYPFPTKAFWVTLGADQAMHHLTYAFIALLVVSRFL